MSEMIERIGRQLAAEHYAKRFGKPIDDPHVQMNVDANWQMFEGNVRAVIEAMREPTERMLSDADSAIPRAEIDSETGIRMMGREVALEAWRAMIAAALSSEKE